MNDTDRCSVCDGADLVYELRTDRGQVTRCLQCLCVEHAQPGIGWEGWQDYPDDLKQGKLESVNDYLTILARIRQDDPIIKRDPDSFGTVSENARTFLTNFMGSDAHQAPSELSDNDGDEEA